MTGGGIECVLRSVSDHHWGCEVRCEVAPIWPPALVSTTGLPRRVGGRIARRIAAASRQGLSAQWRGTGAVTGGD